MRHASQRLVSNTAKKTAISTSHLKQFPPKEALFKHGQFPSQFSPDVWPSLQPPTPAALSAFAHRLGLAPILDTPALTQQVCTHPSFVPFHQRYYPNETAPASNAQLAALGNSLMGLFASEFLHAQYPYIPTRVLKALVTAHVGPLTTATVAQEMGAQSLLRWHRAAMSPTKPSLLHSDALASIPRALTGLIYQKRSLLSARKFVHAFFMSRQVDIRSMLKFSNPKMALAEAVERYQRAPPKSRLLKETGRYSNSPIYVVGIFSGADKLGEGFGSSLKMAEYRAAEDSLHRLFLTRTPENLIQLPSSTFASSGGDILANLFEEGDVAAEEGAYEPSVLPEIDLMYASSGRSKVMVEGRKPSSS